MYSKRRVCKEQKAQAKSKLRLINFSYCKMETCFRMEEVLPLSKKECKSGLVWPNF
jgi:hypothetical protein